MRQLTSLDAQFLALETPRIYGHVSGVLVLDPSTAPDGTLTLADLQNLIMERLPLIPIFKWRLAEVPFGLDFAYWVDDPDFDIDFHVRELALVPPGSTAQLEEQVARIFSRPLDRSRPLWEIYLIHGLEDGRVALMTKVHHAVIDGLSGAEILGSLLDLTPEGRPAPEPDDEMADRDAVAARDARARPDRRSAVPDPPAPLAPCRAAELRGGRHLQHPSRSEPGRRGGTAHAGGAAPEPGRQWTQAPHSPAHVIQRQGVGAPSHRLRTAPA